MPDCTIPALVAALELMLAQAPKVVHGENTVPSICTPCSCPSEPGACHDYLAVEERRRAAEQQQMRDLLAACREPGAEGN